MRLSEEDRFWSHVDKDTPYGPDGDCWRWTASVDSTGHGRFRAWGRQPGAHRYSFVYHGGVLPTAAKPHDACVLHTCDMRDCVNPQHLYASDQGENIDDREARRHLRVWKRFAFRRPEAVKRPTSPINAELVLAFRQDPRSQAAIAADLGVAQATIHNIKSRKTWSHIV